jgi:hypothetical protein
MSDGVLSEAQALKFSAEKARCLTVATAFYKK